MKEVCEKHREQLKALEDALNGIEAELQRDYIGVNILISDLRNNHNNIKSFLVGLKVDLGNFKKND